MERHAVGEQGELQLRKVHRSLQRTAAPERLGVPEVRPGLGLLPAERVGAVRHDARPVVLAEAVGGEQGLGDARVLGVLQPVVVQLLNGILLMEARQVGHVGVHDVEARAALLDLGEHLLVKGFTTLIRMPVSLVNGS